MFLVVECIECYPIRALHFCPNHRARRHTLKTEESIRLCGENELGDKKRSIVSLNNAPICKEIRPLKDLPAIDFTIHSPSS